jgi:hypothetical protein
MFPVLPRTTASGSFGEKSKPKNHRLHLFKILFDRTGTKPEQFCGQA